MLSNAASFKAYYAEINNCFPRNKFVITIICGWL